ncbi:winged helix DNA-binding domain-containing protein [Cylindrobasidium torrendii FP15055 ss-10]|uniref:Winged helix DNA-binding domain-containing protein n=1 Tax=Cylindrobasidium torrendii FP15055 ss-10 TaxID=1314674 RepID=A0A0D7BLA2_9AGAR|nr:winged helix DNA-binding domain-containing protein [Cylindrobasidium torrendii FP15055 ss-10]
MHASTFTTTSGFLLPSVHSLPPFFTLQAACPPALAKFTDDWIKTILAYARHRQLFFLKVEDAETTGNEWDEVLKNERINRKLPPPFLEHIISTMVTRNLAVYEPAKQTRTVLLHWRLPQEWADTLHQWATDTGHLNTILTFYEITDPPVDSPLTGIPVPLLRHAIQELAKTNLAQIISIADGEGVRFFAPSGR